MKTALELIADERTRQIIAEGRTHMHDDQHLGQEIALAAACYASPAFARTLSVSENGLGDRVPMFWPWEPCWWKPTPSDRERELVKAGALIVAEIERLRRTRGVAGPPNCTTHPSTIREWLLILPPEYRERAIKNTSDERLETLCGSLDDALLNAFTWKESPEGGGFWDALHGHMTNIDDDIYRLPPLPTDVPASKPEPTLKEVLEFIAGTLENNVPKATSGVESIWSVAEAIRVTIHELYERK